MRTRSLALALLTSLPMTAGDGDPALAAVVARSAADVCDVSEDPCIVTDEVDIAPGSVLDFGHRTLRIESGGILDYGTSPARVRCGRLEADVDEGDTAVRASGTDDAASDPAVRLLEVVRQCSGRSRDCLSDVDCELGACDVRLCAGDWTVQCYSDAGCNLGICGDTHQCSLGFDGSDCQTNADCQLGPCGTGLNCRGSGHYILPFHLEDGPVACQSNADCSFGSCTVGDGGVAIGGSIDLDLVYPHDFRLLAASDLALRAPVEITGREGQVEMVSMQGDVAIEGPIRTGGQRGAFVFVKAAAGNLSLDAPITGDGRKAGAQVGLFSGRDLLVHDDILARTTDQRDHGGQLYLDAGRDLRIEGGTPEDPLDLHVGFLQPPAPGSPDGRGGYVLFDAGRDLAIGDHVRVAIDGSDTSSVVTAGRDLEIDGAISAITSGAGTRASTLFLSAGTDLALAPGSSAEIAAEDGSIAGLLRLEAERDLKIDATLRIHGAAELTAVPEPPGVRVEGCMVAIGPDADLLDAGDGATNRIFARGALDVEDGASWSCDGCANLARVRKGENPLALAGAIDPPMVVKVDPALRACPNCIDPLDGDRVLCDDGVACTKDICTSGSCSPVPDDASCEDEFYCDGPASCSIDGGCRNGPAIDCSHLDDGCYVGTCDEATRSCIAVLVDGIPCDDGDACTDSDRCDHDVCMGRRNVACGDCGNGTLEWGEGCDDGDAAFTPGDLCSADCQALGCGHPAGTTGPSPTAKDALYVLRSSVGLAECPLVICDVNGSDDVEASDALLVLKSAVGLLSLDCPPAGA